MVLAPKKGGVKKKATTAPEQPAKQ